jgi:hypothetical protein
MAVGAGGVFGSAAVLLVTIQTIRMAERSRLRLFGVAVPALMFDRTAVRFVTVHARDMASVRVVVLLGVTARTASRAASRMVWQPFVTSGACLMAVIFGDVGKDVFVALAANDLASVS